MKTIKPTKSPIGSPPEMTRTYSSFGRHNESSPFDRGDDSSEDYSDLAPSDELELDQKLAKFKLNGLHMNKIYRPEDISMLSLRGNSAPSMPSSSRGASGAFSLPPRFSSSSSFGSGSSRSPSRASSYKVTTVEDVEHLRATEQELRKYAENDDEDYDDVFVGAGASERKERKRFPVGRRTCR
jgi:hypothetical protein